MATDDTMITIPANNATDFPGLVIMVDNRRIVGSEITSTYDAITASGSQELIVILLAQPVLVLDAIVPAPFSHFFFGVHTSNSGTGDPSFLVGVFTTFVIYTGPEA